MSARTWGFESPRPHLVCPGQSAVIGADWARWSQNGHRKVATLDPNMSDDELEQMVQLAIEQAQRAERERDDALARDDRKAADAAENRRLTAIGKSDVGQAMLRDRQAGL